MSIGKYILDGHMPILCEDVIEWGRWLENADRHVALDELPPPIDRQVSTVFLGLDQNFWTEDHTPLLFETMVFRQGDDEAFPNDRESVDEYTRRYTTWEEAEQGHKQVIQKIKTDLRIDI